MDDRLQKFIDAENISQSQLADMLGVTRASVSHILSGRNKPGFDFIVSISRHFPTLNLDWLIKGTGKMYKSESVQPSAPRLPQEAPVIEETDLFPIEAPSDLPEIEEIPVLQESVAVERPAIKTENAPENTVQHTVKEEDNSPHIKQSFKSGRSISKIIVFYDDNTYQELK